MFHFASILVCRLHQQLSASANASMLLFATTYTLNSCVADLSAKW